ncbi:hypothetical protein BDAP_001713 [Binucleata daphniae]
MLNNIFSFPSSCILELIFILMDCVSYGRALLPANDNKIAENISMFIFLSSSLAAQVIFGLTTNIKSGIIAGTIVENFKIFEKIYNTCKETNLNNNFDEIIFNTFVCLFIGTMLFSFISFLLMKLKLAKILKIIPKSAITGCFGAIGISQFEVGLKEIGFDFKNVTKAFFIFLFITILLSFLAFVLQELLPNVIFIIPLYSAIVISLFYGICFFGIEKQDLIDKSWLADEQPIFLTPKLILDYINYKYFDIKSIYNNIPNIISLALFSLIHLPINLPVYSLETKIQTDFTKELKTQSVANFVTAFLFSPTYFVCSNSIFFRRSGGTTKPHTILLGFSIVVLFFYGTTLKSYLPCVVLAMFPFFIGINICYSAFYKSYFACTKTDYAICLVTTAVCYLTSIEKGIFVGTFLNTVWFMRYYLKNLKSTKKHKELVIENKEENARDGTTQNNYKTKYNDENISEISSIAVEETGYGKEYIRWAGNDDTTTTPTIQHNTVPQIVSVDYILCFVTLNKFESQIKNIDQTKPVIFDFRSCYCVDWLAKDYFYDYVSVLKAKIEIVGLPLFLDTNKLKKCRIYENEDEFYISRK